MSFADVLTRHGLAGLVLFVGAAQSAPDLAKKLGLSEVYVADTDEAALENLPKDVSEVKIVPVFTRVIERLVELPSNSFDVVVSIHGLEKALNKRAFMTEARRLLKDGGKLFLVVKLRRFFSKQGLRKDELEKLLQTHGFSRLEVRFTRSEAQAVLIKSPSKESG